MAALVDEVIQGRHSFHTGKPSARDYEK